MSLNGASIVNDNLILLVNERIFYTVDNVRLEYTSGSGYPGMNDINYSCAKGKLILTTLRTVYVPSQTIHFTNLNIPILNFRKPEFLQPWFSCNKFQAEVISLPNGGLNPNDPGNLIFYFTNGGGFEYYSIYMQLLSRITTPEPDESLPVYLPPNSS